MNLREAYIHVSSQLSAQMEEGEARSVARLLMESVSGFEGINWFMNQAQELDEEQVAKVEASLLSLKSHIPLQHITGTAWFYGMQLKVSPAVLIPRQETEQLVRLALPYCKAGTHVLDLCTGSGCIAIAIKCNAPNCEVSALDISVEAIAIALENAKTQRTEITFSIGDITENPPIFLQKQWDVIVSNPPYIPYKELPTLDEQVREHEPHLALFSAFDDDLFFYKAIAQNYLPLLSPEGVLLFELHAALANETAELFRSMGYEASIINDIHERPRFLKVKRV